MGWQDILKNSELHYQRILDTIDKVQNMIDNLHADIDKSAKEMSDATGFPIESARKLIGGMHTKLFTTLDKELSLLNILLQKIVERGLA